MSRENAYPLAVMPVTTPGLVLWSRTPGSFGARERRLRSGSALEVEEITRGGITSITVLWNSADRMYVLHSRLKKPCEQLMEFAGLFENAITVANSI
jgi:hypothetical protein